MKHSILRSIIFFVLIVISTGIKGQEYTGTWKGNGIQIDDPATWSIQVTLHGTKGTAVFSSLGCKIALNFLRKEKNYFIFSETITSGTDKCLAGLNIKLALLEDDKNIMNLFEIDAEGRMISYATLAKQQ